MHTYDGLYVIFVPHHVVAIEVIGTEIYICDNHCKTPLDIRQSARLTQRVELVLKVSPRDPPRFIKAHIQLNKISTSIGRANNRIEIYSVNEYENPEDNNQYYLGSINYKDNFELNDIINKLIEEKGKI